MLKTFGFWLTLFFLLQISILYVQISHGDVPFGEDQDAYLEAVSQARQGVSYFDGQRNPLLPVLLSFLLPSDPDQWFTYSRFWVALLSAALIVYQSIKVRGLWGNTAGILWFFFMGFNNVFLSHGAMVMVEPLLLGFVGLFLIRFIEASLQSQGWGWVGFWLGLALLAKGTMPILVCVLVMALLINKSYRELAHSLAVCFLTYAPFLIYRALAFGNPWYQVSHGLSWRDFYHPHNLDGWTFYQFLDVHGILGIFSRLIEGLGPAMETGVSALSPLSSSKKYSLAVFILFLLLPVGLSLVKKAQKVKRGHLLVNGKVRWLLIFWTLLFVFFCAWMVPIANVPRYWVPLIPVVSLLIILIWKRFVGFGQYLTTVISFVILIVFLYVRPYPNDIRQDYLINPDLSWREDADYENYQRVRRAIESATTAEQLVLLYGPGKTLPNNWFWQCKRVTLDWRDQQNEEKVHEVFQKSRFWVLDDLTRQNNGEIFQRLSSNLPHPNFPHCRLVDRWIKDGQLIEVWENQGE